MKLMRIMLKPCIPFLMQLARMNFVRLLLVLWLRRLKIFFN